MKTGCTYDKTGVIVDDRVSLRGERGRAGLILPIADVTIFRRHHRPQPEHRRQSRPSPASSPFPTMVMAGAIGTTVSPSAWYRCATTTAATDHTLNPRLPAHSRGDRLQTPEPRRPDLTFATARDMLERLPLRPRGRARLRYRRPPKEPTATPETLRPTDREGMANSGKQWSDAI